VLDAGRKLDLSFDISSFSLLGLDVSPSKSAKKF